MHHGCASICAMVSRCERSTTRIRRIRSWISAESVTVSVGKRKPPSCAKRRISQKIFAHKSAKWFIEIGFLHSEIKRVR